MQWLFGGLFLGWALGSNDAANVFGTAVSSRMIKYRYAIILASIFVIIGAVLKGANGIHTLSGLSIQTIQTASLVSLAAAITVTIMTFFKMPISTSQAVVGAIIGQSVVKGTLNLSGLYKVIACWIGTPVGSFFLSMVLYFILKKIIEYFRINFIFVDGWVRYAFIIVGCYGSYALGANNVANVVGIYKDLAPFFTTFNLTIIGGISIAVGIITYSRRVMFTVGKKLVEMNAIMSFVALLSCSLTVHFYALVGVPVSSSQAIVGAVLGMGALNSPHSLNWKILFGIIGAWGLTPLIGAGISFALNTLI